MGKQNCPVLKGPGGVEVCSWDESDDDYRRPKVGVVSVVVVVVVRRCIGQGNIHPVGGGVKQGG